MFNNHVQMRFTDYSCIFPCEEYDDCYSISIDLTSNKDENIAIVTWLKGTDPFPKHHSNIIHRMNAEPYQNTDIILNLLMWHINNNQCVLPLLWSLQSAHIVCALLFREIIQHSIVIFKSLPTHNLKNDKNIELYKKHIISTYILGSRMLN